MASQSRKHRGYKSQDLIAEYFRDIFPYAESTGAGRQGPDVTGTPGLAIEAKARSGFNPKAALKQAHEGAPEGALPVTIMRLNGQGPKSIGEWVVCMRVDTLKELLREAGYGAE